MTITISLNQVVRVFNYVYEYHKMDGDTKNDFYCGITHNLKERNAAHQIQDGDILLDINTNSFEMAKEVEAALHQDGFNTGGQVGNGIPQSTIVYMYRRTQASKP